MNRTVIFLSIILLFILLAGGVYFFVLRDTGDTGTPNNPSFNIDGTPIETPGGEDSFIVDIETPAAERAALTQIHALSVAGATVYTNEVEIVMGSTTEPVRTPVVRFVDKQTGHIFEYDTETGSPSRISNTTFPGIQEVSWFSDVQKIMFRYLTNDGEIETYLGDLSSGSLTGSYLELNIPEVATFSDTLLTTSVSNRGSEIYLSEADGRNSTLVFETPLTSILVPSFGEDFVAILTKPVSSLAGALYFVEDGGQKRILGGKNGLTALPNKDGSLVLFGESTERGFTSSLFDRGSGQIRPLPIEVFPEKCVWGSLETIYCMSPKVLPPANYPEHWYQGFISFTDGLWEINVRTGIARARAFFDEEGPFDGIELSVDEDEEYITFINRRDGTLWGFDL